MRDVFDQEAERLLHLKVMSQQMSQLARYLELAGVISRELSGICAYRAHRCWVAESDHWDDGRFREYEWDEG